MKKQNILEKKDIAHRLGDIQSEIRTLTGIIGIMFGFLLATTFSAQNLTELENYLLIGALFCSILSLGIFTLPIIYHHLKFPYVELNKFMNRVHRFTIIGFIPFTLTFVFSTSLALERLIPKYGHYIVLVIIIILIVIYTIRKSEYDFK